MKQAAAWVVCVVLGVGSSALAACDSTCQSQSSGAFTTQLPYSNVSYFNDIYNYEIGVRFKANVPGQLTGLRFYKLPQNTSAHTGTLWDAQTQTVIAQVQFTNETSSGWQKAFFANPITLVVGKQYIVTYWNKGGQFANDLSYFKYSGLDSPDGHLTLLQDDRALGGTGPNGVDQYGTALAPGSLFPNGSHSATNYWVDPLFRATTGRVYPKHTNIVATTFWVGEKFQDTADGSQLCSAYDSDWQFSFFQQNAGTEPTGGCAGSKVGGCDALRADPSGPCDDVNSVGSLRTPQNGYFPAGLDPIYENPFYLDLPYDDVNPSDPTAGFYSGWSTRCNDIPWANDPGYAGNCTNAAFSYMKNRWVKLWNHANPAKVCYGQIEDAGPADIGAGNGHYDDRTYVFGSTDARPFNTSYNGAGADISPALGACLGGVFNEDLIVDWQFVEAADVPGGPWKQLVTSSQVQ